MKTIDEMCEVMQAHKNGKKVEISTNGIDWKYAPFPTWNWYSNDYRVKSEQR